MNKGISVIGIKDYAMDVDRFRSHHQLNAYKAVRLNPRNWFRTACRWQEWYSGEVALNCLSYLGGCKVTRGKRGNAKTDRNTKNFGTTFINIPIDVASGKAIKELYDDPDTLFDSFADLVATGHKVSFTHNPVNGAFIVAVTGKEDETVNSGYTYSSFAGDWLTALKVAMYKHFVVAKGKWLEVAQDRELPEFG